VIDPLELAERALTHATGEAQVTVVAERSLSSRFARSRPTQATAIDDLTVQILCVGSGRCAGASTNATDREALADTARRAQAALERALSHGEGEGAHPGLPGAEEAPGVATGEPAGMGRPSPKRAGAALERAFAAAAALDLEAFGIWSAGEVLTAIASTSGLRARERVSDAYMKVICRDRRGATGFAAHTSPDSAQIDGGSLVAQAAARVGRGEAAELEPGSYPVVLSPAAVGTLLEFLAGLGFNGQAHVEGRGALSGRLGTRVAAPCIDLADAPGHAGTLRHTFDAEGVRKRPLDLIQDGVAHAVAHDRSSAARAGAHSTGHALAPGGSPEGAWPTNLVLAGGGARDEQELMAGIERGLYVTRLWYVNPVHERDVLLTGVTRDGTMLIEDGELRGPVRDVRFTDSVLRLLAHTEELTSTAHLVSEGEFYGRRAAVATLCPALRAGGFVVTGPAG